MYQITIAGDRDLIHKDRHVSLAIIDRLGWSQAMSSPMPLGTCSSGLWPKNCNHQDGHVKGELKRDGGQDHPLVSIPHMKTFIPFE